MNNSFIYNHQSSVSIESTRTYENVVLINMKKSFVDFTGHLIFIIKL